MARYKVFVTREIPKQGLDILAEHCDYEMNPDDRVLTEDEIIQGAKGKDGLLCLLTDRIGARIMDEVMPKVISNYAVGVDNIDIQAATERGILVTNTPGVLTETTADQTFALLLGVARRIVESDRYIRDGRFNGWGPMLMLGTDVHSKTIGIIGLGKVGTAVARRAKGFKMKILYHSRTRKPDVDRELGAQYQDMNSLLQNSDFVVLTTALTPETKELIGKRELDLMKPSAFLINTARGGVVDEAELVDALRERRIAGAGLDVFKDEPHFINQDIYDLDNVVMAPHTGSATVETRGKMSILAAENLVAALHGKMPKHPVNPEVLDG